MSGNNVHERQADITITSCLGVISDNPLFENVIKISSGTTDLSPMILESPPVGCTPWMQCFLYDPYGSVSTPSFLVRDEWTNTLTINK